VLTSAKGLVIRLQFALKEQGDRVFRSASLPQSVGLNSLAHQGFCGSASHAVAEDSGAVPERFHNGSVALRAMTLAPFTVAFSSGVSRERVASHFLADELAFLDVEN
jgi:hypothetical protein